MQDWYVTYMDATGRRRTFEVPADNQADAGQLGEVLAAAWAKQEGMPAAPKQSHCAPVPPDWICVFGQRERDGGITRVTYAPTTDALLTADNEKLSPWIGDEPLPWRLDLRAHSPSGLEWGYMGSGPAQLSLAVSAFVLGDEKAERVYQGLKERLFAGIQSAGWSVTAGRVRELAAEVESGKEDRA